MKSTYPAWGAMLLACVSALCAGPYETTEAQTVTALLENGSAQVTVPKGSLVEVENFDPSKDNQTARFGAFTVTLPTVILRPKEVDAQKEIQPSETPKAFPQSKSETPKAADLSQVGYGQRDGIWHLNLEEAKKTAQEQDKKMLILFTGSDWCAPCQTLEKNILRKSAFEKRIAKDYVLLKIDRLKKRFPGDDNIRAYQKNLIEHYNIKEYPNVLITDADGKNPDRIPAIHNSRDMDDFFASLEKGYWGSAVNKTNDTWKPPGKENSE